MRRVVALSALACLGARGGCILPCPDKHFSTTVTLDAGTCDPTATLDCSSICHPDPTLGETATCACASDGIAAAAVTCNYVDTRVQCGD